MSTTLELPTGSHAVVAALSKWEKLKYELHHPENHKQLIRFLCVGGTAYVVNLATFTLCIHLGVVDFAALVIGFLVSNATNFVLSRHWTFDARADHAGYQGLRFFTVSVGVFLISTGIYTLLRGTTGMEKTLADGVAWAIATPLSFLAQKFWTFRA